MKPILLHGKTVNREGQPLICVPIVGRTPTLVIAELEAVLAKQPDLIEWRVDFFQEIGDAVAVIDTARRIKDAAGGIPLIFTIRSAKEGGTPIALHESDVLKLYVAACASRCVDIIDYELSNPLGSIERLRSTSRDNDVAMIMSFHDFASTPESSAISAKFMEAERLGADIAKVAVMPQSEADVLTLLGASLQASTACKIPLISMSMGGLGALSRIVGWQFGSAVTFAVGKSSSAPGQIPIEELRSVLATVFSAAKVS